MNFVEQKANEYKEKSSQETHAQQNAERQARTHRDNALRYEGAAAAMENLAETQARIEAVKAEAAERAAVAKAQAEDNAAKVAAVQVQGSKAETVTRRGRKKTATLVAAPEPAETEEGPNGSDIEVDSTDESPQE